MEAIKERKKLEKKYTKLCLKYKHSLPTKNGRIMSVSPTSYYYNTDVNPIAGDIPYFRKLNEKAHYGIRLKIEREVLEILQNCFKGHFFQVKDKVLKISFEKLNIIFQRNSKKTIKLDKYNRLIKLLRRWGEESKNCHYKINSAEKRLSKKYEN